MEKIAFYRRLALVFMVAVILTSALCLPQTAFAVADSEGWLLNPDGENYYIKYNSTWQIEWNSAFALPYNIDWSKDKTTFPWNNIITDPPDGSSTYDWYVGTFFDPGTKIYIRISLTNKGGVYYQDTEFFTVDGTAPSNPQNFNAYTDSLMATSLESNKWYNYSTPYFTWSAGSDTGAGVRHYHVYLERDPNGAPETENTSRDFAANLTINGTYYFKLNTEDNSHSTDVHPGNVSAPVQFFVYKFDTDKPSAQIDEPSSTNDYTNDPSFEVKWSGSDGTDPTKCSGIASFEVEYSTDSVNWTTWKTAGSTVTSARFDRPVTDGTKYYFRVRATDNASNEGNWSIQDRAFTVDLTPPASTIRPFPSSIVTNDRFTVAWGAVEPPEDVSGISKYTIEYKANLGGEWKEWLEDTTATSGIFLWLDIDPSLNGKKVYFRSTATDNADNVEATKEVPHAGIKSISIEVGGASPSNVNVVVNGTNASCSWSAAVPPAGTDVFGYSYSLDASPDNTIENDATHLTASLNNVAEGRHVFFVRAIFISGMPSEVAYKDFIVDITPPLVTLSAPEVNAGNVVISGTATDNVEVSGIEYVFTGQNHNTVISDRAAANDGSFNSTEEAFRILKTLPDDTYTVSVKAFDILGRYSDPTQESFTINAGGPEIGLNVGTASFVTGGSGVIRTDSPFRLSFMDGNGLGIATLEVSGNNYYETATFTLDPSSFSQSIQWTSPTALAEGEYNIYISAADASGNRSDFFAVVQAFSGDVRVEKEHYNYPNPFDPLKGTTIKYFLTDNSNVKLLIYNMNAKPVKTMPIPAGSLGGCAGWNLVLWDGKDNFGNYVANGPYFYFIIVDGKVIGKGDMAAFR